MNKNPGNSQILIYQTENNLTKIEVKLVDESVWLTQKQIAELFDCSVDNISLHLKNIFKSAELKEKSVVEEYSITANDGKNYITNFYNLDAIISVGYRISSVRATEFRIWATKTLREYIIKGFVMLKKNWGSLITANSTVDNRSLFQYSCISRYLRENTRKINGAKKQSNDIRTIKSYPPNFKGVAGRRISEINAYTSAINPLYSAKKRHSWMRPNGYRQDRGFCNSNASNFEQGAAS